jgi:hypothetical protein
VCWLPLFVTVIVDAKFEVPASVYRYMTMTASANSSLTPLLYLTILVPRVNKYCFAFLRTDGIYDERKSLLYSHLSSYYRKIGDRFHKHSEGCRFSEFTRDKEPRRATIRRMHSYRSELVIRSSSVRDAYEISEPEIVLKLVEPSTHFIEP